MNKEELNNVKGGASVSWLNAISRAASLLYQLGRSLGSTIRYQVIGKTCR